MVNFGLLYHTVRDDRRLQMEWRWYDTDETKSRHVVAGNRNSAPRLPKGPVPSLPNCRLELASNFLSVWILRFEFMGLMAEGGRARKRKGVHLGVPRCLRARLLPPFPLPRLTAHRAERGGSEAPDSS